MEENLATAVVFFFVCLLLFLALPNKKKTANIERAAAVPFCATITNFRVDLFQLCKPI